LAALRVRSRIFDVLRFGTPMAAMRKAGNQEKTTGRIEKTNRANYCPRRSQMMASLETAAACSNHEL